MEHVIYGLREPRGLVRYVGYTGNGIKRRLLEHIWEAQHKFRRIRRHYWLRKLHRDGKKPTIVVLERITFEDWKARETFWITKLAMNDLVNSTSGGEGLINPSKAIRRKIGRKVSLSLIGNQRRKGILHTVATRKKISKSLHDSKAFKESHLRRRGKHPIISQESRVRMGWAKGTKFTYEHCRSISNASLGNKSALGCRWAHRGTKNKLLKASEQLPKGWKYGRVMQQDKHGCFKVSGSSSRMVA